MVLPFVLPATLILRFAGPGRDEEPSGGDILRLIQDPFSDVEFGKNLASLSSQFAARANHRCMGDSPRCDDVIALNLPVRRNWTKGSNARVRSVIFVLC